MYVYGDTQRIIKIFFHKLNRTKNHPDFFGTVIALYVSEVVSKVS